MVKSKAVILYGPPGAGKGTQAELLVRTRNFVHFDTGRYLEKELIYSPQPKNKNSTLARERKLFIEGKLCTPSFVLNLVKRETKKLVALGADIVYSGSPRTLYEAFGTKKVEGLIPSLINLLGRENVYIILIDVPEEVSLHRNTQRKICSVCGLQMLAGFKQERCSFCYGKLRKRVLDKPSIIKVRLREYEERTFPIMRELEKRKFTNLFKIDGTPHPFEVNKEIIKIITQK